MKDKGNDLGTRLGSMILDHFAMTFISTLVGFVVFGVVFLIAYLTTGLDFDNGMFGILFPTLMATVYPVYFNKDAIGGRSPAKRMLKLMVVDQKTGMAANPIKCVLRNVTLVFWPLEVIFVLMSPSRRLGDRIAGTKVVGFDETLKRKSKPFEIIIALIISGIYMIPIVWFLTYFGGLP